MRLALLTVVLALPALAPAQQGNDAEKLFRAMEDRLARAKTLSLKFEIDGELGDMGKVKFDGSLVLGGGNKVRLEGTRQFFGKNDKVELVSDGTRLRATVNGEREAKLLATPKQFHGALAKALGSVGVFAGLLELAPGADRKLELSPEELFPASDFKLAPKEKVRGREAQVLTHRVKDRCKENVLVTVWIDTKTNLPLRRVVSDENRTNVRVTEYYTDFKTDEKLDAKQFELPK